MRKLTTQAITMAAGAAMLASPHSRAGTFSANFNTGTTAPAGSTLNGGGGGGVIEAGVLKLTKAVNGQSGSFVIDDLDGGNPVYGFDFSAKLRLGGGSTPPADGFSINFDPTATSASTTGEEGTPGGITVSFDIFDNGNETPTAPSIDVKIGGQVVATRQMPYTEMRTGSGFADLHLVVAADGSLTLTYKGNVLFDHVYFPGYQPISGGLFVLGARTGGLNENIWFDDISINTFTTPSAGFAAQPTSVTVLAGKNAVFAPVLNNADGATFQWFKGVNPINGADSAVLTIPSVSLADSGSSYTLKVTSSGNTVTSDAAVLTVVDIPLPTATVSFDFSDPDGNAPFGTTLFTSGEGAGYISLPGGPDEAGVLHLTDAANGVSGGIIIDDLDAGAPVYALTASFKARVGGGSGRPADGFSFNYASDVPDSPTGEFENGIGTGLTVGFDIYDNGGGEAPSVDVRYGGQLVAQKKVPFSFIDTGADFVDVLVNLQNDGTLDVAYKGVVLFNNLTIPGFTSIAGGRFALGSRTGGENENVWIDDLSLSTSTTPGDLRITSDPASRYVLTGQTVNLSVTLNDSTGVTYQWLKNNNPIQGATSADYSFVSQASDDGAEIRVKATKGALTATSAAATVTVLSITPTLALDFNDGLQPAGTDLKGDNGGGTISSDGGVDGSGVLHVTDAVNGQAGTFVIRPLLAGAEISAVTIAFDLRLGGGSGNPADGLSFNYASDLPSTTIGGAEDGAGTGLTIGFDIYDNGGGEAPSIDVRYKGALLAQTKPTKAEIQTGDGFRTVIVRITQDGKLDLVYGDRILQKGLQLPGYAPVSNGRFGWYARTGGENENQWVDNIRIQATKSTAPLRIVGEPADALAIVGQSATFTASVSDPIGATYQWYRGVDPIQGATTATYTTPSLTLADNGAKFSLKATGPGGSPGSRQATVTVVAALTITNPGIFFNFDDGIIPDGTILNSDPGDGGEPAGYITTDGGVDNSGVLHLTDSFNGSGGTFIIPPANPDQSVNAFTAHFKLRIGGGSAVPADGVSFIWASDIDNGVVFGEGGSGSGLVVSFDTYNNGNNEAPAFNIFYKGNDVADLNVPIESLLTGDGFADVYIRVEADGTADLQYNGRAIFSNVQLPEFEPLIGGSFAVGARTGGLNANQWVDDLGIAIATSSPATHLETTRQADGSFKISWNGVGVLQSAPTVKGPWTVVDGATNPAIIQTGGVQSYYRVAIPQ